MFAGVWQQPTPVGEIVSHAVRLALIAEALKLNAVPVLPTAMICDDGFEPPSVMLKFRAPAWLNTFAPINTLTGMVTFPVAALKTSSPVKVPEVSPPPGRAAVFTPTVTVEGAFPVVEDVTSHLPPSDVIVLRAQPNVPDPAARIFTVWDGGLAVLGANEKLI
jgi:hypothetical protein